MEMCRVRTEADAIHAVFAPREMNAQNQLDAIGSSVHEDRRLLRSAVGI